MSANMARLQASRYSRADFLKRCRLKHMKKHREVLWVDNNDQSSSFSEQEIALIISQGL